MEMTISWIVWYYAFLDVFFEAILHYGFYGHQFFPQRAMHLSRLTVEAG